MFDNNINNFLKPIDIHKICGSDIRNTDTYNAIKDLRIELQTNEVSNNSEWKYKNKGTNYETLVGMCENILKNVSKDLMIANYYLEAVFKTNSLHGLRHGLQVFNSLCENFWENIYPNFTVNEYEFRVMPFKLLQKNLLKIMSSYAIIDEKEEKILISQFTDETNATKKNSIKLKIESIISKIPNNIIQENINILNEINESIEKTNEFIELIPHDDIDIFACQKYIKQSEKILQSSIDKRAPIEFKNDDETLSIINNVVKKCEASLPLSIPNATIIEPKIENQYNYVENYIKNKEEAYLNIKKSIDFLLNEDPQSIIPNMLNKIMFYKNLPLHIVFKDLTEICNGQNSFIKFFQPEDLN